MTAPELERRLTGLLLARAQDAMERTSTQENLSSLLASRRLDRGQRGRRWATAGGLVVAAATVAVAAWMPSGDGDRTEPMPSGGGDGTEPTSAGVDTVQLASDFLAAAYSPDGDRAASFLSPDVQISHDGVVGTVPESEWRDELAWHRAIGAMMVDHTCQAQETSGPTSEVTCTYSLHGLGSDQLRRRPYVGNTLDVTIRDGLIVAFEDEWHYWENGFSAEMWEPFADWIVRKHPSDVRVMYTDSSRACPGSHPGHCGAGSSAPPSGSPSSPDLSHMAPLRVNIGPAQLTTPLLDGDWLIHAKDERRTALCHDPTSRPSGAGSSSAACWPARSWRRRSRRTASARSWPSR